MVRSSRKHCNPNKNDSKSSLRGACEVVALGQVLFDEQRESGQSRLSPLHSPRAEDFHTMLALGSAD